MGSNGNDETINQEAKEHYRKAGVIFESKEYVKAIEEYDISIKIQPDYASAYYNRALARALLHDYDSALKDAVMVYRLEPASCDAPYIMGMIAEYQYRYDDALAWYKEALSINPKYENARQRLQALEKKINPPATASRSMTFEDSIVDGQIKSVSFFKPKEGFEGVVGLEKEKDYFRFNVILAIQKPELFKKYGKKISAGIILYGAPGVGKTHLVRAVAAEAGANVIVARAPQLLDMWSGNTEKNIHAIFEQARQNRPCIIIFEEIDGLGINRESTNHSQENVYLRLAVNQLLVEMDGIENNLDGIFVIATTNSPQSVDPALKRSGRFSDLLYVSAPSKEDRKNLFAYFTRQIPRANLDFHKLAEMTEYYSPADVSRICDKATLLLIRSESEKGEEGQLTTADLIEIVKTDGTRGRSILEWYSNIESNLLNGKFEVEDQMLYETIQSDLERKVSFAHHTERDLIYN